MLKKFTYTKANGSQSERVVYPIHMPSDMLFCIDLTEFSNEERKHYETQLDLLYKDVTDAIADIGLRGQYRNFKESGIEWDEDSSS